MTFPEKVSKFCKRNVVALTLVPLIVGIHWGWDRLQDNPIFVRPDERKELPIIIATKKLWRGVTGSTD